MNTLPDAHASFADLGVPTPIATALAAQGVHQPFPIQAAAVPAALKGDVCGKAPTGSGKTIAFGIPLVALVGKAGRHQPTGLVLVPTRELAEQVRRQLDPLARSVGRSVTSIYGGVGFGPQISAMRRGVDIVVACPGRLADLVKSGEVDLGKVEVVVVDEADRMSDMGFLPEVKRLLDRTPDTRRTLLFSATLDGEVDVLVSRYTRHPTVVEAAGAGGPDDEPGEVVHEFWAVDGPARVERIAELVQARGRTIVFCRTKHGADRLAKQLSRRGVAAQPIHGDRSQGQRQRALDGFAGGGVDALVATDVAARGIHVDDVACVVQYDPPSTSKDYVHRAGRTGRAGQVGFAVSLVVPDRRADVEKLQRALGLPRGLTAPPAMPPVPASAAHAPAPTATPTRHHRDDRTGNGGRRRTPGRSAQARAGAGARQGGRDGGGRGRRR